MQRKHSDWMSNVPESSFEELQGRMLLMRISPALSVDDRPVALPSCAPPSLEGLVVSIPPRVPVTGQDIHERFQDLCRESARRRVLERDEAIAEGDEVSLDVIGFARRRPIPFSSRSDWRAVVAPEPLLPGFFEALVGLHVGAEVEIQVMLPSDYPVASLREVPARFVMEVKAAHELLVPNADSPACLALLGRGSTLDEVMLRIGEELQDEREVAAVHEARERVLDMLVERSAVALPVALVDEEIRRLWMTTERPVLQRRQCSAEVFQEALEGWLTDPSIRDDAERRLKVSLILGAAAARDRVQPRGASMRSLWGRLATLANLPYEELKTTLESTPGLARRAHNVLLQLATLDHVMAQVRFEER